MRMIVAATVAGCLGISIAVSAIGHGRWTIRTALSILAEPRSTVSERIRRTVRETLRSPSPALRPLVRAIAPVGLVLTGRSLERHLAVIALAVGGAAVMASSGAVLLARSRLLPFGVSIPVVVVIAAAALAVIVVQSQATSRIAQIRADIRHQLSCYLDLVSMLLAGDTGYESALRTAADAGSGHLFDELRARMAGIGSTGDSYVDALETVANDLDLDELTNVAATIRLAADEGAPVVRTLVATCSTMRATLSTEYEAEARLRTGRLTAPLVGMALVFMSLVIYPALQT